MIALLRGIFGNGIFNQQSLGSSIISKAHGETEKEAIKTLKIN